MKKLYIIGLIAITFQLSLQAVEVNVMEIIGKLLPIINRIQVIKPKLDAALPLLKPIPAGVTCFAKKQFPCSQLNNCTNQQACIATTLEQIKNGIKPLFSTLLAEQDAQGNLRGGLVFNIADLLDLPIVKEKIPEEKKEQFRKKLTVVTTSAFAVFCLIDFLVKTLDPKPVGGHAVEPELELPDTNLSDWD